MGVGNPFEKIKVIFLLLLLGFYYSQGADLPCSASKEIHAMLTPVYKLVGPPLDPYSRKYTDAEFFAEVYPIFEVRASRYKGSDTIDTLLIGIYKKQFLKEKWGGLPIVDWTIDKIEPAPHKIHNTEYDFRHEKTYHWVRKEGDIPSTILIYVRVMDHITGRWHRCIYRVFTPFPKVVLLKD